MKIAAYLPDLSDAWTDRRVPVTLYMPAGRGTARLHNGELDTATDTIHVESTWRLVEHPLRKEDK